MLFGAAVVAASLVLNTVVILAAIRAVRGLERQHARREDALIDKVCHLAGKPWNEAPAAVSELEELTPPELVHAPEQYGETWG